MVRNMREINFEIRSNKNENVYCEGYVTINDEEAEEWYFYNGTGIQSRWFTHHDGVILSPTEEQNNEINQFMVDYIDDSDWINTVIVESEEHENKKYVRENLTLIINGGD